MNNSLTIHTGPRAALQLALPEEVSKACITGAWAMNKARNEVFLHGHFTAAAALREQGVPLELALIMLRGARFHNAYPQRKTS